MTTATLNYLKVDSMSMPKIDWKVICLAGFVLTFMALVFYVWQINYLTKGYYLINGYEKQISQLSSENKNLQVSFAENGLLNQVSQEAQVMNFEKVTSVKYMQISDNSVATAKIIK